MRLRARTAAVLVSAFMSASAQAQTPPPATMKTSVIRIFSFCSAKGNPVWASVRFASKKRINGDAVDAMNKSIDGVEGKLSGFLQEMVDTQMPQATQEQRMNSLLDEINAAIRGEIGSPISMWFEGGATVKLDQTCGPAV
jgi:type IV secretory pathway VirB2 component (pilin)